MRKFMLMALATAAFACNNNKEAEVKGTADTTATAALPYQVGYSSQFQIGNSSHAATVLGLYKHFDNNTIEKARELFADSVIMYFSNGDVYTGPRDSMLAMTKAYRSSLGNVNTTIDAVVPLRSTDRNEDWVAVWSMEHRKDSAGKADSTAFQETWRLNANGKINLLFQYEMKRAAAQKQ